MVALAKTNTIYPPSLLCDFYKVSHRKQFPIGTRYIYSTLTPRTNKYFPRATKVLAFGFQSFVKKYLINYFNVHFFNRPKEEVVAEYKRYIKFTLGEENPDATHIEELHDLGYLPIRVSAVKEGTLVPIKVPLLTIENTKPEFFWLTNYLETILSAETWLPMTSATIAHEYRKLLDEYAMKTVGSTDAVDFQAHDFSLRGMANLEAGAISGAAHLVPFSGTDTIPGIAHLEAYYDANIEKELVGTSIPATEHSVMSAGTDADNRDEYDMFKRLITEVYPKGFVSIVSDTYDFWKVIGEILPRLKDEIMSRDGKVVIRPDSGDPVDILCGTLQAPIFDNFEHAKEILGAPKSHIYLRDKVYLDASTNKYMRYLYQTQTAEEYETTIEERGLIQELWNIFGGTISEKGFKILDSHIGAIYGDSITIDRAEQIVQRLASKGFASINVVLGIGSYTYQYNTRDTLGFAIKATYADINGEERLLFKDPKTDDGTKRSQRGRVFVFKDKDGRISFVDGLNRADENKLIENGEGLLEPIFEDGKLLRDQSLSDVRATYKAQ